MKNLNKLHEKYKKECELEMIHLKDPVDRFDYYIAKIQKQQKKLRKMLNELEELVNE